MFTPASPFICDMSKWQMGKVTDMSWMFLDAHAFPSDLSRRETGNVIGMRYICFLVLGP